MKRYFLAPTLIIAVATLSFFALEVPFAEAAITRNNAVAGTLALSNSAIVNLGFTANIGDTLVVVVAIRGNATITCSVSATGASFVQVFKQVASAGTSEQCMNYAVNLSQATTSVLISSPSGNSVKDYAVIDFSGVASASELDTDATTTASGSPGKGAAITTTNANDVVIQAISSSGNAGGTTYTSAGPTDAGTTATTWTGDANVSNAGGNTGSIDLAAADSIVSSTGTYQASWTLLTTTGYTEGALALKASSGGGGGGSTSTTKGQSKVLIRNTALYIRQGAVYIR